MRKIILFAVLLVLFFSVSNLAHAQESNTNQSWFQKLVNFVVSLFTLSTETSTITTQTENATYRNLTPVTPANEPLAKPVEKIDESQRHGVYINESEFYKDRVRSWSACYGFECFTPAERRGQASIDYFKSLNLTDDFIYVIMQFDAPGGDPTVEQMNLLAVDNITLFEYHGDHSYYAKAPRAILESKSYDFVRWAGIAEKPLMKIDTGSPIRYIYNNCTGSIKLTAVFYEKLNDEQTNKIRELVNSFNYGNIGIVEINVSKIYDFVSLNFVERVEWYSPPSLAGGSSSKGTFSDITCNSSINVILSFDGLITNELYNKIKEISENIITYETPDKPMCVSINPLNIWNPVGSFKLTSVLKGFMIENDTYSIVAVDEATKTILKNVSC